MEILICIIFFLHTVCQLPGNRALFCCINLSVLRIILIRSILFTCNAFYSFVIFYYLSLPAFIGFSTSISTSPISGYNSRLAGENLAAFVNFQLCLGYFLISFQYFLTNVLKFPQRLHQISVSNQTGLLKMSTETYHHPHNVLFFF